MNDPLFVRRRDSLGDPDRQRERFAAREAAYGEPFPQGFPFEQLEHEVGTAVVDPEIMNREDVGVVELSRGPGFLLEAMEPPRFRGKGSRQHLDGDRAADPRVAGTIDLRKPPASERFDQLVASQQSSGRKRHGVERSAGASGCLKAGSTPGSESRPDSIRRSPGLILRKDPLDYLPNSRLALPASDGPGQSPSREELPRFDVQLGLRAGGTGVLG